jgi:serine protease Do
VDSSGYIVTNAHVVEDARRIRVRLTAHADEDDDTPSVGAALEQSFVTAKEATLVGMFKQGDLALIKIAAEGLPALPFADYRSLRQGQVVFAFGRREGLQNSVSMGVVSSVARQIDTDSPFIYVQTDAAINPGDSGGPLVNTAGEIVGLDTFILTKSGGSEGIGFAIPSPLVEIVADQLKTHGHFHRQIIGVGVQSIQPSLAAALHLSRTSGVIISDVLPGSPAETAGLQLNDVVLAANGKTVRNLPGYMMTMLAARSGEPLVLQVLRGGRTVTASVVPVEQSHKVDRLTELLVARDSEVPELGILGITVGKDNAAAFEDLRLPAGVYVAGWCISAGDRPRGLSAGDVIHRVNGTAVNTVSDLRRLMHASNRGDPIVLLIERDDKLQYLAFERN